jgi:hypothetical protein
VLFTGLCLAIGVCTWIFSAIKFQADMGLMLTFMLLWNMFGALWLLPALARVPDQAGETGGAEGQFVVRSLTLVEMKKPQPWLRLFYFSHSTSPPHRVLR